MKRILIWLGVIFSDFFYGLAETLSPHREEQHKIDEYLDKMEEHLGIVDGPLGDDEIKTEPHIKQSIVPSIEEPELPLIKLDFSKLDEALKELEALEARFNPIETPPELPPSILNLRSQGPIIKGLDGKAIPASNKDEELPEYLIFKAMFERKFGRFGICPLQFSGHQKDFNCDELYSFLYQIRYVEPPEPTLGALYGAVIEVILRGHGETLEAKGLN